MQTLDLPLQSTEVRCALRVNQAGQAGAINFYRGMRRASADPELNELITERIATEQAHFEFFSACLEPSLRSRWQPVWRLFGSVLGYWSGLMGVQSAYQTIDALETFLRRHYEGQLTALATVPEAQSLVARLRGYQLDEVASRDEIRDRLLAPPSWRIRLWHRLIERASRVGVFISKRI